MPDLAPGHVKRLYIWHESSGSLMLADDCVIVALNQVEADEIQGGHEVPPEKISRPIIE